MDTELPQQHSFSLGGAQESKMGGRRSERDPSSCIGLGHGEHSRQKKGPVRERKEQERRPSSVSDTQCAVPL